MQTGSSGSTSPGHVGHYAVCVQFSLPWKKDRPRAAPVQETKKRKKTLKPIVHPIFEKCIEITDDKFWQSTFLDCARGKFPRGYTFKNNLLTHKKGNKISTLELDSSSKTEVFYSTKAFFHACSGLMSAADRKYKQKQEEEKMLEEMESFDDMTWKDVRTDKLKELMITEFICSICTKMKYNEEEKRELITVVKKGLMLKYFNSDNIIMEGGRIVEIDGLIFNESKNMYEIDSSYCKKTERRGVLGALGIEKTEKKIEVDFMEIWKKYLESLENKRTKKSTTFSSSNILNESDELSKSFYSGI